jgi:hypothetical protein
MLELSMRLYREQHKQQFLLMKLPQEGNLVKAQGVNGSGYHDSYQLLDIRNFHPNTPFNITNKIKNHGPNTVPYVNTLFGIYVCYPSTWISSEELYPSLYPDFNPDLDTDLFVVRLEPAESRLPLENLTTYVKDPNDQLTVFPSSLNTSTWMELRVHNLYNPKVINSSDQERLESYKNKRVANILKQPASANNIMKNNLLPFSISYLGSDIIQLINTTLMDVPAYKCVYTSSYALNVPPSKPAQGNSTKNNTTKTINNAVQTKKISFVFTDWYLYKKPYSYSISYASTVDNYFNNLATMNKLIKSTRIINSTILN